MAGLANGDPVPIDVPPVGLEYQSTCPEEQLAVKFTEPNPQMLAPDELVMLGTLFTTMVCVLGALTPFALLATKLT